MKQSIALFLFAGFLAIIFSSYSSGYAANAGGDGTGASGSTGCSCHSSTSSIGTKVELDSAGIPVTSYHGGMAYTVKISATNNTTHTTLKAFGFQLATVKASGAGSSSALQAGTWSTSLPTSVQNTSAASGWGGSFDMIEQSAAINDSGSTTGAVGSRYIESIGWTAPATGTGSIKIYGIINASNHNGSSSGDYYQAANAVTITEAVAVAQVASISISQTSGTNPTCAGSSVTFTATPANGGTVPTYQWKVNGTAVSGATSATYTTTTLATGSVVTCVMTSNLTGVTGSPATSNSITMTINPAVVPAVSISTPNQTICSGASVTFTATPTNGGTPSYQWKVNGTNVGTNSATYTTTALTTGQIVTCVMTSTATCASPATATSNSLTMTVNPSVTPSVSIAGTTTICTGQSVTFTATPTNGGTPSYQWKINGTNVGTNSPTYTTTTLTNGQVVTCVMTSTATCASPATATSNSLTITVSGSVVPSVSISTPTTTICSGASTVFTATPTNGGTTPSYQWKVNATNVGTNSPTYTTSALTNGQVVTCVMTSSSSCASPTTGTSNSLTMTVSGAVVPSVSISTPNQTICSGASATFTATPTNGGTTPSYQWKINGTNVGTNSATYTTTALTTGQVVTCVVTSSSACASPTTATSNSLNMTVNPSVTPAVSISGTTTICSGQSATFTATPTNGGTPSYQWQVNGSNVGTNSNTYTSNALTNGQIVTCVMTSTAACASPATATSNSLTITVSGSIVPSVSITTPSTFICPGTSATFTATPTNGGTSPSYQWKVNGTNAGTNSPTFTTTTLTNGQIVTCVMTSSSSCASPTTATSNAITITVGTVSPSITISTTTTSACAGSAYNFTATAANGGTSPSYQWQVNGTNAGTNSSTFTSTALTNGQVVTCVLTSSLACASPTTATSNSITAVINPAVTPTVTVIPTSSSICTGGTDTFAASGTNLGTSPSYQWQVNGSIQGTNSPVFVTSSLTVNGSSISCIVTSNAACASPLQASGSTIVSIVAGPTVSITPSGSVTICAGDSVQLTASGASNYNWTTNAQTAAIWVHQSGTYNVTGTDVACSSAATAPAVVTIDNPTTPTVTQSGNVITSSPAAGYQWILNNNPLTGDTAMAYTINQTASYEVITRDAFGCYARSISYVFTYVDGIVGVSQNLGVIIYPIPNQGIFAVDGSNLTGASLDIYDIYGQKLYQQQLSTDHNQINSGTLSSAIYFVTVSKNGKTETIKMQVTKE